MKYRPHLPDDCPPKDAKPTFSVVYRMIAGDTPTSEDFLSFRELKPHKSYPSDCIASGLSVYTELEGIKRLKRRIPRFREMKAAQGSITPEHGTMKNTPSNLHSSHNTWWLQADVEPSEFFEAIDLSEDKT